MTVFLIDIDNKFNMLMKKNKILVNDLIELKEFIIEAYENDRIIEINNLKISQQKLTLDLYNY